MYIYIKYMGDQSATQREMNKIEKHSESVFEKWFICAPHYACRYFLMPDRKIHSGGGCLLRLSSIFKYIVERRF